VRLVEEMIDKPVEPFLKRWRAAHEDQLSAGPATGTTRPRSREASSLGTRTGDRRGGLRKAPPSSPMCSAHSALSYDAAGDYWTVTALRVARGSRGRALPLRSNDGVRTVAVLLEVRDDEKGHARLALQRQPPFERVHLGRRPDPLGHNRDCRRREGR
jgi:hypothetical protein